MKYLKCTKKYSDRLSKLIPDRQILTFCYTCFRFSLKDTKIMDTIKSTYLFQEIEEGGTFLNLFYKASFFPDTKTRQ